MGGPCGKDNTRCDNIQPAQRAQSVVDKAVEVLEHIPNGCSQEGKMTSNKKLLYFGAVILDDKRVLKRVSGQECNELHDCLERIFKRSLSPKAHAKMPTYDWDML